MRQGRDYYILVMFCILKGLIFQRLKPRALYNPNPVLPLPLYAILLVPVNLYSHFQVEQPSLEKGNSGLKIGRAHV